MDTQQLQELERIADRFGQEIENVTRYLDELTTDGAGVLYDLKMAVGADSDLGATISSLGGTVMTAKSSLFEALNYAKNTMDTKVADAKAYNVAAESDYAATNTTISNITFQK